MKTPKEKQLRSKWQFVEIQQGYACGELGKPIHKRYAVFFCKKTLEIKKVEV